MFQSSPIGPRASRRLDRLPEDTLFQSPRRAVIIQRFEGLQSSLLTRGNAANRNTGQFANRGPSDAASSNTGNATNRNTGDDASHNRIAHVVHYEIFHDFPPEQVLTARQRDRLHTEPVAQLPEEEREVVLVSTIIVIYFL